MKILFKALVIFVFLYGNYVCADEYNNVDNPKQYQDGNYIYGGTIINIIRLDNNDDWVVFNGGRYKYRVDCKNCGECWHGWDEKTGEERCYMISESWEEENNKKQGETTNDNRRL